MDLNGRPWCEYFEHQRELREETNKKNDPKRQIRLLCDIYQKLFQIIVHTEKSVGIESNLLIIFIELMFNRETSQSDISKKYGINITTISWVISKHAKGDKDVWFKLVSDKRNRKIIQLTDEGKEKADKILEFMWIMLSNTNPAIRKSPDMNAELLEGIFKQTTKLHQWITFVQKNKK